MARLDANQSSDSFIMKLTLRLMTATHTRSIKPYYRGQQRCYFWMHVNQYILRLDMYHHHCWEFQSATQIIDNKHWVTVLH